MCWYKVEAPHISAGVSEWMDEIELMVSSVLVERSEGVTLDFASLELPPPELPPLEVVLPDTVLPELVPPEFVPPEVMPLHLLLPERLLLIRRESFRLLLEAPSESGILF